MKPLERTTLQCIYCDDIRDEVGGKSTIVGWYGSDAPVALPSEGALVISSLGIIGILNLPPDSKYKSMKVELLQNENVLQSVVMPEQTLNEIQLPVNQTPKPLFGREVRVAIKMSNLQIAEPCVLRMRVIVDDEEVYSNGLSFTR